MQMFYMNYIKKLTREFLTKSDANKTNLPRQKTTTFSEKKSRICFVILHPLYLELGYRVVSASSKNEPFDMN